MKTPAEARKHLSEVLKSRKYRQITHVLEQLDNDGNIIGNCCLGVACREAMLDGIELLTRIELFTRIVGTTPPESIEDNCRYCTKFDEYKMFLPERVQNYLGFKDKQGTFSNRVCLVINEEIKEFDSLIAMNDDKIPFDVIADYIEKVELSE